MNVTLCLFRQDPARGGLVRAIGSSLAAGFLMRLVPEISENIARLAVDDLPGGFVPIYLLFTALAATFLLSANAWTRSSRLALGLPLPTRHVWAVRTGSLAAVASMSIVTLAAVMGLSLDLETRSVTMNPVVALAAARAAATALVLLFLYQLPQSKRDRIPIGPPYVVYVIGATLLTIIISSAQVTSPVGTFVLLAIAVALGIYLYRRVPTTFSIGPTIEEADTPVWSMPDERDLALPQPLGDDQLVGDRRNPAHALHWVLFRGLKTNILTWFLIGIVGASATIAILEFLNGTNALLPLFFLTIYQLPLLQAALESTAPFDPLPISRRILWAHSVGPIIISAVVGVFVAGVIFSLNPRSFTHITYSECCVKVPWDYMELSRDGKVPAITTAWGESYTPRAHPLWKGRTAALYDPFEVGKESSPRFIEYQIHRAIEAVYDIPVPAELLRPDNNSPSNIAGGAERGTFITDTIRGRISPDRNRTAAAGLIVLAILSTLLILFSLLQFGSSVHRKAYKWTSIGFIVFVIALTVAVSVARLLGFTEVWYLGALISMGIRSLAHALPLPTSILWIVCVTFWAGAYLLLERVFGTIEFPREKTMNRFAEVY
jgi:hypothetical protein